MNQTIAEVLKGRIDGFTWIGRLAGLVRPITYTRAGTKVTIPVAASVIDRSGCEASDALREMVPDEGYGAMAYFEDGGITSERSRTRGISWTSRLRLVVWVNTSKLGGDLLVPDLAAQNLVHAMTHGPYNTDSLIGVRHSATGMPVRGAGLFSQYTYPESARQYLLHPFDAFAIDIETRFRIRDGCEEDVVAEDIACWTPSVVISPPGPASDCRTLRVCGTPTDGQVPTWVDAEQQYQPQTPASGPGGGDVIAGGTFSWDATLGLIYTRSAVVYQVQLNPQ